MVKILDNQTTDLKEKFSVSVANKACLTLIAN